ncbi:flavin reductase family protein [Aliidiomarina maris]|uniref:Flavin reductase (DIM6/NTAB) family NADH-FMN oxidoreductase RutF n=2 Tax=Aliidiomarina maris TaxID=531312 RepID=A0A327X281_9GAMM|nr:flavin reductase [Aliidiomarina maris]RAJ99234.1 flavin reductase (DIM6/NTAB) family NADH-FMN oxidoreductase RutF [Aliidiomarina maris]
MTESAPVPHQLTRSDIAAMPSRYRAQLINSLTGFKPANLLATQSLQGQPNVAMVSSAVHLGADPALLALVMRPPVVERHSLDNIRETGVYTLNHVHRDILEQAHQTAAKYPRQVSEFDAVGLSIEYPFSFAAPAVAESRLQIGLRLVEIVPIKHNGTEMVIGEIDWVQIKDDILHAEGYAAIEEIGSVTVSGLDSYHLTHSLGRLGYPSV